MTAVRIQREEFLRTLEIVRPGTTPKDISEQSSCVAFKDGYAFTFNEDVFCRAKSGLPKDWLAAVPYLPLVTILSKLGEAELLGELTKSQITLEGKGRKTGIRAEHQITMPFDAVTLPDKSDWWKAPADLADAITLVQDCAGKDADEFALTCLHLHPKFIEASDKTQIARHRIKTRLPEPVMLLKESLSAAASMDIRKLALTDNWFHMRTGSGAIYSVRKNEGNYLDLSPYLKVQGEKVTLPKGLKEASEKAEIFSAEDKDNNVVMVTLNPGRIKIKGSSESGWHRESKKVRYKGPSMSFMIPPKLLREILDRNNECYLSDGKLVVDGGHWTYVSVLVMPDERNDE
jgi:hypothetical protein